MNDEKYWYGVGWTCLLKRVYGVVRQHPPQHGAPDRAWIVEILFPALAALPGGAGNALNCLLGEPDDLLARLQRRPHRLYGCLKDYLWHQKQVCPGDATPHERKQWQAIRKCMRKDFPDDTDWSVEAHQRRLLARLTASGRELPRTLETLQDYLWKFHLRHRLRHREDITDMNGDDIRHLLCHTEAFSGAVMEQLRHCLDQLNQSNGGPLLLAAIRRELDPDAPPLDCAPATHTRRKEKAREALGECMEPVITL